MKPTTPDTSDQPVTAPSAPRTPPHPVPTHPIRMIGLDVDGTLLRSDKHLSPKVAAAVADALAAGIRVVLASARPPRSTRDLFDVLMLDTFQVNYNGALIHDQVNNRHVQHWPLEGALTQRIIKAARKTLPGVVVSVEILDKWYTDHVDETLPTETAKAFTPDFIGPIEAFTNVPVTKLMLLAPPDQIGPVRAVIDRRFAGRAVTLMSDPHLVQVVHPTVCKSAALAFIAEHYGIAADNVMAIGDAGNDVGMLQWAGLGVAVENAWPDAKAAARVIVPSNDDDGVAFAIRKYALGA
jgi:Cof subfamily protein (haloacid dehalogenase superfamily)